MVRSAVSGNGVCAGLPDTGGEVKACDWVRYTVPVQDEASVADGFFMGLFVCFVEC